VSFGVPPIINAIYQFPVTNVKYNHNSTSQAEAEGKARIRSNERTSQSEETQKVFSVQDRHRTYARELYVYIHTYMHKIYIFGKYVPADPGSASLYASSAETLDRTSLVALPEHCDILIIFTVLHSQRHSMETQSSTVRLAGEVDGAQTAATVCRQGNLTGGASSFEKFVDH
jgi:hypothetical protein